MSVFWLRGRHPVRTCRARVHARAFVCSSQRVSPHLCIPDGGLRGQSVHLLQFPALQFGVARDRKELEEERRGKTHNSLEIICFLCRLDARKVDFFLIDCSPKARL